MARVDKGCVDEALKALKDFSADELKDYARDVFDRAKKFTNTTNANAFEKAMAEINDERLKSYFESAMTAANNASKINALADRIKNKKANLMNISIKLHGNQGDNIASAQSAARQTLESSFFDKVTRDQTSYLSSGDNDLAIADAFDGKKVESKEAQVIADLWKNVYFPERNTEMVTSNAMPFEHINQDRSFRNIHDSNKMMLGGRSAIDIAKGKEKYGVEFAKRKWIDTIKKNFDLVKGENLSDEELTAIYSKMYDDITTGKSEIFTRSILVNDRVAIQNRSRRRLQPKSMRDFVEYNKEYGQGNLFSAMLMDMQRSGSQIGMARLIGDSPHAAYLDLKKVQQESNPKRDWWYNHADLAFKEVLGSNKTAVSPTLAAIDSNLRSVTAMARLPLVALRSLPDLNNQAIFAMSHGYNYFSAWGEHIKNLFNVFPSEDRRYLAKLYSGMFREHLGYMGRVVEVNNTSSVLNKISTAFFKLNLLHNFDMGNKMSGIYLVSKGLGRNGKKSFESLPLATKNWVGRFLDPHEWEVLKGKSERGLFTVDNVHALTEKEVKEMYEKSPQLRPQHEYRNDLYRRVHSMAQIASENMVLNPGDFERAFILRGTRPGTPEGIFLRQVSQFKMYTVSFIDRVLIQGYKNADANQQKLAWATSTLVGALPLAYGVMMFENLAMGKSMPDISRMSTGEAEKFLLELSQPGLALFSGMLDPKHQNSDMVLSLLGSPSTRLIGNALATAWSLINLEPKHALKHFRDTMNYVLPLKTTPILSPMLNQAMGDKGHVEPGQHHYFGK